MTVVLLYCTVGAAILVRLRALGWMRDAPCLYWSAAVFACMLIVVMA